MVAGLPEHDTAVDHFFIVMDPGIAGQFGNGVTQRHGPAERAMGGHGDQRIGHPDNARLQGNGAARQPLRIAAAIEVFVVLQHYSGDGPGEVDLFENIVAGLGVLTLFARPGGLGPTPDPVLVVLAGWLLIGWLIPLALVDLEQMWLPEPLCRWGLVCGLAVTAVVGGLQGSSSASRLVLEHLLAVALGLLGFEATTALASRLFGRPALGLGDAMLAALIGAWLGPLGLGLAVALAVISGALLGVLGRLSGRLSRHQAIPFGPFLVLGTLGLWVLGPEPFLRLLALG